LVFCMNLFLVNLRPYNVTRMGSSNTDTSVEAPSWNVYMFNGSLDLIDWVSCSKSSSKMRLERWLKHWLAVQHTAQPAEPQLFEISKAS
jgi:hypothetical protein